MLIYKINTFFFTYFIFITYLYFWWAWPKGACRMQTDRSTDRQTNKLKTARGRERQFRCLLHSGAYA